MPLLKFCQKKNFFILIILNSGQGSASGMFTVTVISNSDIPTITFNVKDQLDRPLVSQRILVGKTTRIHFTGKENPETTVLNLYAHPKGDNINLTNISISLNR